MFRARVNRANVVKKPRGGRAAISLAAPGGGINHEATAAPRRASDAHRLPDQTFERTDE